MYRLICILLLHILLTAAVAQVNIWEGTSVHQNVALTPYLPDTTSSPHIAIIVCPGGSYFWHDTHAEGPLVGQWLQQNGISAFILNYRTAHVPAFLFHHRLLFRGNRYPDAQDDLRQAIRYVKAHAAEYHIDSTKVGVMGFSAGGHLSMLAAEQFNQADRPAFVASIYPVVTMQEPYVHKRSRRGLLGDSRKRNQALCDQLSLERHVPADCPPVFLVNCLDDPIVDYHNALLLDSALTAKQINHRYVQFQTGGHGFGASEQEGTPECHQWKSIFLEWIKKLL